MTYGHIRNIYGLELGTADVAYCSNVVSGIMVCECMCVQGAWLWTRREGGTFAFSAIRLKLAFSEISYCTFNK